MAYEMIRDERPEEIRVQDHYQDGWDVKERIAWNLRDHEEVLKQFLIQYQSILPNPIANQIRDAIHFASQASYQSPPEAKGFIPEPTEECIILAGRFSDLLDQVISNFQTSIDEQTGR